MLAKTLAVAVEKREREAHEKAEKQRAAKEEAEQLAAEKKKKKPIRYPTEDLDVRMADKDKKAGMKLKRPVGNRANVPFNETPGASESFLMSWNFLIVYGSVNLWFTSFERYSNASIFPSSQPLHLSVFSLDELEHALRHSLPETPCSLLEEVHSTLIYNLRTITFQRHNALLSLLQTKETTIEQGLEDEKIFGITIDQLTGAMADVGNNWERVPLRHNEGRDGWEDALVGCLKDVRSLADHWYSSY